jgi:hypothetical protein
MHRQATPIYASTLHRRDRAWGARRRAAARVRARLAGAACGAAVVALAVVAAQHLG